MQTISQLYFQAPPLEVILIVNESLLAVSPMEEQRGSPSLAKKWRKAVSMEEEEDKYWLSYQAVAKAPEEVLLIEVPPELSKTAKGLNQEGSSLSIKVIRLTSRCSSPFRRLVEGVSVVLVQGIIGMKDNKILDLQLDSGTDISLISKELCLSLENTPWLRQGMKLKLHQLTDADTNLIRGVHLYSCFHGHPERKKSQNYGGGIYDATYDSSDTARRGLSASLQANSVETP